MAGKRVKCPRCQTLVSLPPPTPLELEQAAILRLENRHMPRVEKLTRALVGRLAMGVAFLWRLRLPLSAIAVAAGLSVVVWVVATRRAERKPLTPEQKAHDRAVQKMEQHMANLAELQRLDEWNKDLLKRYKTWKASLPDTRYLVNREEASDFYEREVGYRTTAYDFCMQGYDEFTKNKDERLQAQITAQKQKFEAEMATLTLELSRFK
jgi:hypothetical protein